MSEEQSSSDEKLEEIKNRKIEKRLKKLEEKTQKKDQKIEELKNQVEKLKTHSNTINTSKNNTKKQGISRRQFLKKAGLGTAGLAALMTPASALNIDSDSFSVQTSNDGGSTLNEGLFVSENQGVEIPNGDLSLENNNINNVTELIADQIKAQEELELPTQEAENDNQIWIDEDTQSLKVKIQGKTFTAGQPAIPDSDVYLHDDWGDNKLQDREDSGTTTHNGVEGIYRPDWNIPRSSVVAENESLVMNQGVAYTDINLNLDETVTWRCDNIEYEDGGSDNDDQFSIALWSESVNFNHRFMESSYSLLFEPSNDEIKLAYIDSDMNFNELIGNISLPTSPVSSIEVTRSDTGEFSVSVEGTEEGSATDNSLESPEYTAFVSRDDDDYEQSIGEIKVS